jgi:hypothetical protein
MFPRMETTWSGGGCKVSRVTHQACVLLGKNWRQVRQENTRSMQSVGNEEMRAWEVAPWEHDGDV